MSMEERTLVVRNIDGDKIALDLLEELFTNFGPLIRIVLRKSFAFVEYTTKESVGYAWAMVEGITLQGRILHVSPKLQNDPSYRLFRDRLRDYENDIANNVSVFDTFLSTEQNEEKNTMIAVLKSRSSSTSSQASKIRRRYRHYNRHYEARSTYNHVLGKDLLEDRHHRDRYNDEKGRDRDRDHRRHSDQNNNNNERHRVGHYDLRDSLNHRSSTRSDHRYSPYRDDNYEAKRKGNSDNYPRSRSHRY